MAVRLVVSVPGSTDPLPAPYAPASVVTVRITATDAASGAAVAATGVTLSIVNAGGETTVAQGDLTVISTGVWERAVTLDDIGRHVLTASCGGPSAARSADLPLLVLGSAVGLPVPAPTAPAVQEAYESAVLAEASADAAAASAALLSALNAYQPPMAGAPVTTLENWMRQQDRTVVLAERFGVRAGVGVDSTAAMALALAYCAANPGTTLLLPAGDIYFNSVVSGAGVSGFRVPTRTTIAGAGKHATRLRWNDGTPETSLFHNPYTYGPTEDITIRDLTIRGSFDQDFVGQNSFPILLYRVSYLTFENLCIEWCRRMAIATRVCTDVRTTGCTVRYAERDGISHAECVRVSVIDCDITHTDDDGIAIHTTTGNPEPDLNAMPGATAGGVQHLVIVANNRLRDCQGIKCLGLAHGIISGNVLDCVKAQGIVINTVEEYTTTEGKTASAAVLIQGNMISNVIDRLYIDALNNRNPYIRIGGQSARAGTQPSIPGLPAAGSGTVPDPYFWHGSNVNNATQPTPESSGIIITGNVLQRTRQGGVPISTYGRGQCFQRSGWVDATIPTAGYGKEGIYVSTDGAIRNVHIADNVIRGMEEFAVAIWGDGIANDIWVKDNQMVDIGSYAVLWNRSSPGYGRVYVHDNLVDMDPFFRHANRGPNGTWQAIGHPTAVLVQGSGWVDVRRNVFRNMCRDAFQDTSGASDWVQFSDNTLECDPVATGTFSTGNKGIGLVRARGGSRVLRVDSDPTSATYGQTLEASQRSALGMPTTGWYQYGSVVFERVPGAGKPAQWHRVTDGSNHVFGTDWAAVPALNSSWGMDLGPKSGGAATPVLNFFRGSSGVDSSISANATGRLTVSNDLWVTGGFTLTQNISMGFDPNGGLTIGKVTGGTMAGTPYIDFKTGDAAYNVRLISDNTGQLSVMGALSVTGSTTAGSFATAGTLAAPNFATGGDPNGAIILGKTTGGAMAGTPYINFHTGDGTHNVRVISDAASRLSILGDLRVTGGIGFNNVAPVGRVTIAGSRGGNIALAALLTHLHNAGIILDGTSA